MYMIVDHRSVYSINLMAIAFCGGVNYLIEKNKILNWSIITLLLFLVFLFYIWVDK